MKNESRFNSRTPHISEPAQDIFTMPEVYAAYEEFRIKYIGHEITGEGRPDIVRERAGETIIYSGNQPAFSAITTDGRYMVHVRTAPMTSMQPLDLNQRYFAVIGDIESGRHTEYHAVAEEYSKRYGTTTCNRYLQKDAPTSPVAVQEHEVPLWLEYTNQTLQLHIPGESEALGFYSVFEVWNDLEWLAMAHSQEMLEAEKEELIA